MAVRVRAAVDAQDAFREPKRGVRHRFDHLLCVVMLLSYTCVYLSGHPFSGPSGMESGAPLNWSGVL